MKSSKTTQTPADLDKQQLVDELLAKATGGATCINMPTCFSLPTCINMPTCINLPTCFNVAD